MDANNTDMLSLMQSLGVADSRIVQLAQLLQQQNGPGPEMAVEERTLPETAPDYESLLEENAWLNDRIAMFARALGACGKCLGDDPECTLCKGHGVPGRFRPDRTLFADLVLPVITRLNQQIRGRRRRTGSKADSAGRPATIE
jgi:hypothetical protein